MDEGSTQRIYELGQRGQLAEAGAAHIVQESMAMRRRYHSELENASQLIREQQEMSEAMANHYRQDGLQLREACAQYVSLISISAATTEGTTNFSYGTTTQSSAAGSQSSSSAGPPPQAAPKPAAKSMPTRRDMPETEYVPPQKTTERGHLL